MRRTIWDLVDPLTSAGFRERLWCAVILIVALAACVGTIGSLAHGAELSLSAIAGRPAPVSAGPALDLTAIARCRPAIEQVSHQQAATMPPLALGAISPRRAPAPAVVSRPPTRPPAGRMVWQQVCTPRGCFWQWVLAR